MTATAPKKKVRKTAPKMSKVSEVLGPEIVESFLNEDDGGSLPAPPMRPLGKRTAGRLRSGSEVTRINLNGRPHVEVEASARHVAEDLRGAVVRVLVRRGEDGAKVKRAVESCGAVHVVVASVPSDVVTTLPQRDAMVDDPVAALLEYAKRDPLPKGADVAALAREVFDLGAK